MQSNNRRCFRCNGQKKLFKIGSAYSLKDTGGKEVTCPLCNGDGNIPQLKDVAAPKKEKAEQQLSKSQQKKLSSQRRSKRTKEELQDGQAESKL